MNLIHKYVWPITNRDRGSLVNRALSYSSETGGSNPGTVRLLAIVCSLSKTLNLECSGDAWPDPELTLQLSNKAEIFKERRFLYCTPVNV